MPEWKPTAKPRVRSGVPIQTVRAAVVNEVGHDVPVNGQTLRVLPDGHTTPRKRSCSFEEALAALQDAPDSIDPVSYVVGCLVRAGASNLWLDGEPLIATPDTPSVDIRVSATGDGRGVEVRVLGGDS